MSEELESSSPYRIGEKVRIVAMPAYVKTAEPMPMLRPPSVIRLGEEGTLVDRRPGGYWCVRFPKGTFLIESRYFEPAQPPQATPPESHT
ncbi:protein of unknown function (DUF3148) [Rubidibacter lacunae KORDI 51-2]|uniref:DUF3148 domain-containing protein n=1 Tax=Rubidibacter lacunae KORDI 51-2 TaxID=582515 RepID=U5DQP0_9CHRO|nr:DUF3148 domain-containing protein [Rubidibacter lacunae]ERN42000.1 protein of unknown function (DUF3148) [Rubidibacter lacunae KORDI 51-2]